MSNPFDKFRCEEYLGKEFEHGKFHPDEPQDIFPPEKSYLSDDEKFLFIGESFDSHDFKFCYQASKDGIWQYDGSGEIYFCSNRIHDIVEGWFSGQSESWLKMDTLNQWLNIKLYLKSQRDEYCWQVEPLLKYIESCIEMGLNESYFLRAGKDFIEISLENSFSNRLKRKYVSVNFSSYSNSYSSTYLNKYVDRSHSEEYDVDSITISITAAKKWLES